MKKARNPVKATQTALDIVNALREHENLGVTKLAETLDISKSAAHCHLSTLREYGYVVKEADKYRLGLQFIDVAHHVRNKFEIYDLVRDEIDKLAEESRELVLFTVEEQNQGICLHKAEGEHAVQTELYVGYRNDLYHTAVGKAILANKTEEKLLEYLDEVELEARTKFTITSEEQLREELAEIRESGFAYNREETIHGLKGVGVPIKRQNGGVYGAISVIGPTSRMDEERLEQLSQMVYRTVNVIEINATSL
ncbi:IclR family transcriptional regulator [Haladaptatus litoreus]|nr:IclR family transcriptional regulator [Haladaptatus litoreus]